MCVLYIDVCMRVLYIGSCMRVLYIGACMRVLYICSSRRESIHAGFFIDKISLKNQ